MNDLSQIIAIIGAQWGDEGKGKLVDILAEQYDIVVRATGGANAGHTIYTGGKKFVFHLVPSGVLHPGKKAVIGNGCAVHLPTLFDEIDTLEEEGVSLDGRLFLSDRAHIVFDYHKTLDSLLEEQKGGKKIGTTRRGIGPCYTDKMARIGIQMGELLDWESFEQHYRMNIGLHQKMLGQFDHDVEAELRALKNFVPRLKQFVVSSVDFLSLARQDGKKILMEGANGMMLDIDHGTYPFVTSSNSSIGGIVTGSGLPPQFLKSVIGIVKAYTTRVGAGPFPTELDDELGAHIREKGGEYGTTTGRPRRCGWFDAMQMRYSALVNGLTHLNLTKLDVLSGLSTVKIGVKYRYKDNVLLEYPRSLDVLDHLEVEYEEMDGWMEPLDECRSFQDFPHSAQAYVKRIEELAGVCVKFIGVGVERAQMIVV